MKAHELTKPGLYHYRRDGQPWEFAHVTCPHNIIEFRVLSDDGKETSWQSCSKMAKGEFIGPIDPNPPAAEWYVTDRNQKGDSPSGNLKKRGPFKHAETAGAIREEMERTATDKQNELWNLWIEHCPPVS